MALRVLKNIDDIGICNLTSKDVVRHPLVQKIVQAYDDYENKQTAKDCKKAEEEQLRRVASLISIFYINLALSVCAVSGW